MQVTAHKISHWVKLPIVAMAVLFFYASTFGVAHAARYGTNKHTHHGVECVVSVYAKPGDDLLATPTFLFPSSPMVHWIEASPVFMGAVQHDLDIATIRGPPLALTK